MKKQFLFIVLMLAAPAAFAEDSTSLVDFFKKVLNFFDNGLYEVIGNVLKYYVSAVGIFSLELKMAAIEIAAGMADKIISTLNISGTINSLYSALDSKIAAFVAYLKIPDAINLLLSAHLTRFIMNLV